MNIDNQLVLVKIGNYVVPKNAKTYKLMYGLGITHTRLNIDSFQSLIPLLIKPKGYTGKVESFSPIWKAFIAKVNEQWSRIDGCKLKESKGEVRLESGRIDQTPRVKVAVPKLRNIFEKFFRRWGTSYDITVSENRGKILIMIKYRHGVRNPVIPIKPEYEVDPKPITIDLGFTLIEISKEPETTSHHMRVTIKSKCGPIYKNIHTSRFITSELKIDQRLLSLVYK